MLPCRYSYTLAYSTFCYCVVFVICVIFVIIVYIVSILFFDFYFQKYFNKH